METETTLIKHEQISHQDDELPGNSEGQSILDIVERPFPCQICGKAFKLKRHMQQHQLTHLDTKDYECKICSKALARKDSLQYHLRNTHDVDYDDLYPPEQVPDREFVYSCTLCNIELHPSEFRKHKKLHNQLNLENSDSDDDDSGDSDSADHDTTVAEEEEEKSCVPSKDVPNNNSSKELVFTSGKVIFRCSVCNQTKKSLIHIQDHLRTHTTRITGEKSYICQVEGCGKAFCNTVGLRQHGAAHSTERPFCCKFCGKGFKRRSNLEDHEKYHDTEAPKNFLCHLCDKAFSHRKTFAAHLFTHRNAPDQYKCSLCPKAFKFPSSLKTHLKTKHTNLSASDYKDYSTTSN